MILIPRFIVILIKEQREAGLKNSADIFHAVIGLFESHKITERQARWLCAGENRDLLMRALALPDEMVVEDYFVFVNDEGYYLSSINWSTSSTSQELVKDVDKALHLNTRERNVVEEIMELRGFNFKPQKRFLEG